MRNSRVPITWAKLDEFTTYRWRSPGGWYCHNLADGAAQWDIRDGHVRQLYYVCPCGCKQHRSIPIKPYGGAGWEWDGNADAPTLTPSIEHTKSERSANCGWHGHLTAGVWVDA